MDKFWIWTISIWVIGSMQCGILWYMIGLAKSLHRMSEATVYLVRTIDDSATITGE